MEKESAAVRRVAALQVFIGGACYGANATMCKSAFASGFSWQQVVAGQMWCSAALFGLALLVQAARGRGWRRLGARDAAKLVALGFLSCATSVLYYFAMSLLPVEVAITLLFQYSWIGLVIQVIETRRAPRAAEVAAAAVILAGTVFASGVWRTGLAGFSPLGLLLGFLSGVSCALFLALSWKVTVPCSDAQRGFLVCLGASAASLAICPDFIPSGVVFQGMAPYALVMGLFGMLLPVYLFGLGTPHIPAGMATVLASSELPAGLFVSMIALGEPLGPVEWLGVAAILAGVAISQAGEGLSVRPRRREAGARS